MTRPMDAQKTAGSKSKSTISQLTVPETAPQKRPNGFKNIAGLLLPPPTPSICVLILRTNLEQMLAHETIIGWAARLCW